MKEQFNHLKRLLKNVGLVALKYFIFITHTHTHYTHKNKTSHLLETIGVTSFMSAYH